MIITICLLILVYTILGKDIKPLLEKLKNVDWKGICDKTWAVIKEYAKKGGRLACEPLLKLWFVLDEGAAVLYVVKKVHDKMTPDIENKVQDVLDDWFGHECSVSGVNA